MNTVTFPNLNLEFNIDPVAFTIFGKQIYWYGVLIMSSIALVLFFAYRKIKKMDEIDKLERKITWNDITDFVLWMLPIGIIGARLYYCAFHWDYYGEHLGDIIKIWNGGLAIYGGVIGGVITGLVFCKIKKINHLDLGDFCMPYVALCQSIGRWGNFINQEAHGEITDSFFKMGIYNTAKKTYEYYHPTFLYESFCNLIIFFLLSIRYKNEKFKGEVFYLYFILYGIIRFFIEGLRTDSLYIWNTNLRVSQVLSLILVFFFSMAYLYRRFNVKAMIIKFRRKE